MKFDIVVAVVLAVGVFAAYGYSGTSSAADDPTNGNAKVPSVKYQSPFRDYRPLGEDKLIPWKAANDEVNRIGGWRTYAREAREVTPVTSAPVVPDANAAPMPMEHPKPSAEPPVKRESGHAGHGQPK